MMTTVTCRDPATGRRISRMVYRMSAAAPAGASRAVPAGGRVSRLFRALGDRLRGRHADVVTVYVDSVRI